MARFSCKSNKRRRNLRGLSMHLCNKPLPKIANAEYCNWPSMRLVRWKLTWSCIKVLARCPLYAYVNPQSFCLIVHGRFMHVPRNTMEEELKGQEKELSDDIANLNKKVGFMYHLSWDLVYASAFKSKYLEKQYNDAQSQLRDIVSFYSSFSKRWLL